MTQIKGTLYVTGKINNTASFSIEALEAAAILLPSNITVFTLDFSGSGLSDGDYVSLGWYEKDDLKVVVSYLRSSEQISCIGLWGRSMGAVIRLQKCDALILFDVMQSSLWSRRPIYRWNGVGQCLFKLI
ncbi:hypothetical protein TEA_008189 [Camellia sinensis var. sinensis]|uniref:Serine aminopeptidase S33 domain-containing protein n=1 Tax=Camellia sinensis var. sinensis TaxID=542762 RepID=A0A4S4EKJ7_CAMSN|nr:hypothetical protein TEA_008189 [Camellia sinensis var. sinensis]